MKKFAPLLLLLLALVIYAPALRAGFVWDDRALVLGDPLIRSWRLAWEGFQHFLFVDATASDFYRPLQQLTYLADYAAFVFAPRGYHLVSILWHAAAASALFFFGEELLRLENVAERRRTLIALLAAIVWTIHPLQSAAVAYVSGRADPLMAAFGFLALWLGLRMLRAPGAARWLFGIAATLSLLASALSKEMGLLFLFLYLFLVLSQKKRAAIFQSLGMIACVLVVYLSLRLPAEHIAPPASAPPTPLLVRPIVVARAVAEYAGLLVLPWRLHLDRDVETHPFGFVPASLDAAAWRELQTLLGILLVAAAIYALWRARKRPAVFLPLLLAAISYLPVSGIVELNATVAEHWLYLPSAFLFLAAAAALDSLGLFVRPRSLIANAAIVGLTTWIFFLGGRAFVRAGDWRDQRTFLTRNIEAGGDSARMWINLGGLELSENHLDAAQRDLATALRKDPSNPLALLNLAAVEIRRGDFARARAILQKITAPPEILARAEESLAVIENRETGQVDLLRLRLAARTGPADWSIEKRYIKALADTGHLDRALVELKTCLGVAPWRAESWQITAALLDRIGRPSEARLALDEAEADDVHLHEHPGPSF
ncbi:MAG TPA: tetratricopeptide repeat protein [Chthoniobacterales bacterium]|jgi:tetratricopeptide (TPR) repeat protein